MPDIISYPKLRRLAREHGICKMVAETVKGVIDDDQAWKSYGKRFNTSGVRKAFSGT